MISVYFYVCFLCNNTNCLEEASRVRVASVTHIVPHRVYGLCVVHRTLLCLRIGVACAIVFNNQSLLDLLNTKGILIVVLVAGLNLYSPSQPSRSSTHLKPSEDCCSLASD